MKDKEFKKKLNENPTYKKYAQQDAKRWVSAFEKVNTKERNNQTKKVIKKLVDLVDLKKLGGKNGN